MNRQSPPHLVATPLAAPGTKTPAAHPPIWHYGPNIPVVGSTGLGLFGFFVGLLLLLPGYGLVMLVILGLEAMQGVPPSHGTSFTESWLILPLLGTAVLMGVMLAWASSAPRVQAFTFDENQQLLTLTVTHRVRKPIEVRVPFSDIIYICPYVVAMFDRHGHFSVVCQGPKRNVSEYRLAEGSSLEEMEFHAAWLRGMIGERMHELLNLDK